MTPTPNPATLTAVEPTLKQQLRAYEEALIRAALARNQGNVSATARDLGVKLRGLHYTMARLGIDPAAYRPRA